MGQPFFPGPEWGTRDANGRALMYPGPDGVTAYRNGYPVGIVGETNPEACDGTCRAQCSICGLQRLGRADQVTKRPVLLDLFCGAGLAADGYVAAGFEVIGVDINPQPDYPYAFIQANALEWMAVGLPPNVAAIHASPPCQLHTRASKLRDAQGGRSRYRDLLTPAMIHLHNERRPWVIENVEDARPLMPGAVRLCGSSFWLGVQRHRLFLSNIELQGTACDHGRFPPDPVTGKPRPWGIYHTPGDSIPKGGRTAHNSEHGRLLMGVSRRLPWDALKEGVPPAYTEYVGAQIMAALRG